ncbi:MAG: hypothetical protein Q9225_000781 [Loekoesia sp. 1 TL-2023]
MADPPHTPPNRPGVHFTSPPEAPSKSGKGKGKSILKPYRELTPANTGSTTVDHDMLHLSLGSPFTSPPVTATKNECYTPDLPFLVNLIKEVEERQAAKSMASQGTTPGANPHRPLPYNAPSATEDPEEVKERLRRANQFAMPTEPSDPSVFKHLVAIPGHAAFHSAARSHAVDRTGQLSLSLPTPRPGSASAELLRTRSQPKSHHGAAEPSPTSGVQKKRSQPSFSIALEDTADTSLDDPDYNQGPAPKAPRGGPRTRFHHLPGSIGIPRRQLRERSRSKTPIVHHSALQTSSPDARATSVAGNPAPEPPSCQECPEYWSTGSGFDPLENLEEHEEEIIHSAPLQPCSHTEVHGNEPHYVCASCRVRAAKHRAKHFKEFVQQPRSLSLCDHCATLGVAAVAKPEDMEDGKLKRLGCTCGNNWMCFECGLREMQNAKMKYDVEWDFRRGLVGVGVLDGEKCAWISNRCICGTPLQGNEKAWRCTNCGGIGFRM